MPRVCDIYTAVPEALNPRAPEVEESALPVKAPTTQTSQPPITEDARRVLFAAYQVLLFPAGCQKDSRGTRDDESAHEQ